MVTTTHLRMIRLKYGITLLELEQHCGFSNQYLSLLELGKANRTPRNEQILDRALNEVLALRTEKLAELRQTYQMYQGRFLETLEVDADEL